MTPTTPPPEPEAARVQVRLTRNAQCGACGRTIKAGNQAVRPSPTVTLCIPCAS